MLKRSLEKCRLLSSLRLATSLLWECLVPLPLPLPSLLTSRLLPLPYLPLPPPPQRQRRLVGPMGRQVSGVVPCCVPPPLIRRLPPHIHHHQPHYPQSSRNDVIVKKDVAEDVINFSVPLPIKNQPGKRRAVVVKISSVLQTSSVLTLDQRSKKDRKDKKPEKSVADTSKVLHLTDSKVSIKTDIESELALHSFFLRSLKNVGSNGGVYIDSYTAPAFKEHTSSFCPAAKRCLIIPNAGGKSAIPSEALSLQYFYERFAAKKFLLEMEIEIFFDNWKLVDFVCNIYGERVGVSVTRAMRFDDPAMFSEDDAKELLRKKLYGLVMARKNATEKNSFNVIFLHIWCQTLDIAEKIKAAQPAVLAEDETDTYREVIILCSVYHEPYIYHNKPGSRSLSAAKRIKGEKS